MMRKVCAGVAVAAVAYMALVPRPAATEGGEQKWGTIKGRIVWGGPNAPAAQKINVTVDKPHCLSKGDLYDEDLVVNPKDKGVKWVIVWLAPESADASLPVNPALKTPKKKAVELDQPCCQFVPRVVVMQEGQDLLVKNSAPVNHNIQWISVGDNAPGGNVTLPPGKSHLIKGLVAERLPMTVRCNIHPWMQGRVAIFKHPYFAVTDAHGNFVIKDAPAGKFRLVAYQEKIGWRGGAKGRKGQEITIKAGTTTDLGNLPIGGQ